MAISPKKDRHELTTPVLHVPWNLGGCHRDTKTLVTAWGRVPWFSLSPWQFLIFFEYYHKHVPFFQRLKKHLKIEHIWY